MFILPKGSYDLDRVMASGQVFNYEVQYSDGKPWYTIVSGDQVCFAQRCEEGFTITPIESSTDDYWINYFNATEEWKEILTLVEGNRFLVDLVQKQKNLHILRQDPWEMLVSYIISANNNVSRIKKCIRTLCNCAGHPIGTGQHSFPTPEEVLKANLAEVRLGYRELSVKGVAALVVNKTVMLDRLMYPGCSYQRAIQELVRIPGVGMKVADCVAAYGLGHGEAFPIDVHMKRILQMDELQGFRYTDVGVHAALLQLYLFEYDLHRYTLS